MWDRSEQALEEEFRARREARQHANKKCGKCGRGWPETKFARHPRTKDRLQAWCIDCAKEAGKLGGRPKGSGSKLKLTPEEIGWIKVVRKIRET